MRWHRRILVALVVGALLAGATVVGVQTMSALAPVCAPVRLVAAPDIAPFVNQVAHTLDEQGCAAFTVEPRSSATEAAALAVADGNDPPKVWLPESSALLARARKLGATQVPASGESFAASPVVMALAQDAVTRLGPGRPTCAALFADDRVVVGAPDPTRDPLGLAVLLEADADLTAGPAGGAGLAAFFRRLQDHVGGVGEDFFARLPGAAQTTTPITAFPTTEQQLLRHNTDDPADALTAAYLDAAKTWMDYPLTVLTTATPAERDAAARLLAALRSADGQAKLGAGGFRGVDGQVWRDRSVDGHTLSDVPGPPTPLLDSPATDGVLQRWATATRSGRIEVLLDVSGSMSAIVPKLGVSRLTAALDATERGLPLFQPTTSLGLWTFATRLDGNQDYHQVLAVTPVPELLSSGQAEEALRSIRVVPNGQTGLYDSVLGLYEEARRHWEPGKLNVVVVVTDGNNDDPAGISRADLLKRLAAESDPNRPLAVIGVAIGPDVNGAELDQIARATGGRSFTVTDPSRIGDVFFSALAALSKS